jgi:hypothetical protein
MLSRRYPRILGYCLQSVFAISMCKNGRNVCTKKCLQKGGVVDSIKSYNACGLSDPIKSCFMSSDVSCWVIALRTSTVIGW